MLRLRPSLWKDFIVQEFQRSDISTPRTEKKRLSFILRLQICRLDTSRSLEVENSSGFELHTVRRNWLLALFLADLLVVEDEVAIARSTRRLNSTSSLLSMIA